jgi:hypothetical protein
MFARATALRSVLHVHADMGKMAEKFLNEVLLKTTSRYVRRYHL